LEQLTPRLVEASLAMRGQPDPSRSARARGLQPPRPTSPRLDRPLEQKGPSAPAFLPTASADTPSSNRALPPTAPFARASPCMRRCSSPPTLEFGDPAPVSCL